MSRSFFQDRDSRHRLKHPFLYSNSIRKGVSLERYTCCSAKDDEARISKNHGMPISSSWSGSCNWNYIPGCIFFTLLKVQHIKVICRKFTLYTCLGQNNEDITACGSSINIHLVSSNCSRSMSRSRTWNRILS